MSSIVKRILLALLASLLAGAGGAGGVSVTVDSLTDTRDYVLGVASPHGNPSPPVGPHSYAWRAAVTCAVEQSALESGIGWRNLGWTGTGSVPASGETNTTGSLTLTNLHSSIEWQWQTEFAITNVVAAQRPGTKLVDIAYDIVSDVTNDAPISFSVSHVGLPIATNGAVGDIGAHVLPGPGKAITWNAGANWNGNSDDLVFTVRHSTYEHFESSCVQSVDTRDYSLRVVSERGSPAPPVGTNVYAWGSSAVCSVASSAVDGGILWSCAGWAGTGSVLAGGTTNATGTVDLNALDSSITWHWETDFAMTNVAAVQRPGTKLVDITYDIVSAVTNGVPISVIIEWDGMPVSSDIIWGDTGDSVIPGIGKATVWNAGMDWNGNEGELHFSVRHSTETQFYSSATAHINTLLPGIATVSLPAGMEMVPYSAQLTASNGIPPYVWHLSAGELPAGLSMSPSGLISGTPIEMVNPPMTIVVFDSLGDMDQKNLGIAIAANPNTRPVLASKIPDTDIVFMLEAGSETFRVFGYDPEGIDLDYTWVWDWKVVGSNKSVYAHAAPWGKTGWRTLRCYLSDDLWINAVYAEWSIFVEQVPRTILTESMHSGQEMVHYSAWLSATNGAEPFTWSIGAEASLPPGLTCSPDGHVSGHPAQAGEYAVRFIARDAVGIATSKMMNVSIAANSNLRPVLFGRAPDAAAVAMNEATSRLFRVYAYDPEGVDLSYSWMWNGTPVGVNSDRYTHITDWGDAGRHVLRCYVSDDLWTNVVFNQWVVDVNDDNDGDGMPNWMERDLGRDPNDPSDGGGPSILSGTVSGGGSPLADAYVELRGTGGRTYHRTHSTVDGTYAIGGIQPGQYFVKAGAEQYKDEWFERATHRSNAVAVAIAPTSRVDGFDFDLEPGQNRALVAVSSEPAGAKIYLDYQPTPYVTPAVLSVGEVASQSIRLGPASHSLWVGSGIASHVISVRNTGHPRAAPMPVPALEAETVSLHFDLTGSEIGSISVATDPEGAEVFVGWVEEPEGITPVVVGNLAPGSHTILLRAPGYLQPRPVVARVEAGQTTAIEIPLASMLSPDRIVANVQSMPTNARVFVDYLPTPDVTDVVVDWMDPASHAGSGWHSASHTIMLRQPGMMEGAARYVPDVVDIVHAMTIHLEVDPASVIDSNGDGIPDWVWDAYGFDPLNPPDADSDDGSGMSYKDKIQAGLIPGDPESRFAVEALEMVAQPGSQSLTFIFGTVPGRRYMVQSTASADGEWVGLGGVIMATQYQTVLTVQVPEDSVHHFYRLLVLVP